MRFKVLDRPSRRNWLVLNGIVRTVKLLAGVDEVSVTVAIGWLVVMNWRNLVCKIVVKVVSVGGETGDRDMDNMLSDK